MRPGDVYAGDQEHATHGGEEGEQGRPEGIAGYFFARRRDPDTRWTAPPSLRSQSLCDAVELGLCLRYGYAWAESSHGLAYGGGPSFSIESRCREIECGCRPDVSVARQVRKHRGQAGRHHSHYGGITVQCDGPAEDLGVALGLGFPIAVGDDRHAGIVADFVRSELTTENGLNLQDLEQVADHKGGIEAFGSPLAGGADPPITISGQAFEGMIQLDPTVDPEIVGEFLAAMRAGFVEQGQPLRVRKRQRTQHERVDDGEHRRVGARP